MDACERPCSHLGVLVHVDQDTRTVSISNGFRTVYVQGAEGVIPDRQNYETLEAPTGASNTESLDNLALLLKNNHDLRLRLRDGNPQAKSH